jgi:hypothetical protein
MQRAYNPHMPKQSLGYMCDSAREGADGWQNPPPGLGSPLPSHRAVPKIIILLNISLQINFCPPIYIF